MQVTLVWSSARHSGARNVRLAAQLSFLLLVQFALPMTCLPVNCNKQCNLLRKKHSMRKHTSS